MSDYDDFTLDSTLEHYGIKGMRWGVKKAEEGGRAVGRGASSAGKKAKKLTQDEIAAIERRRKIGYELAKNVLIGGAAFGAGAVLGTPGAGMLVSTTLTAASKAIENAKKTGEEAVEDMKDHKF